MSEKIAPDATALIRPKDMCAGSATGFVSAETQAQPGYRKYGQLVADIESGAIRIPTFQRDFVWNLQKPAVLTGSVLKGCPAGTLIFWKTADRLPGVGPLHAQAASSKTNVRIGADGCADSQLCATGQKNPA